MTTVSATPTPPPSDAVEFTASTGDNQWSLSLLVDAMHCGACVQRIESALGAEAGMRSARANLTERKLVLAWNGERRRADDWIAALSRLGYHAQPFNPEQLVNQEQVESKHLLRALAVAGFAAGNVMLLSISIWAGHSQGMGEATRTLFHWISGLIAVPAVAYAGMPFFRSATNAIRHRNLNMDVPISVAILLATGVSVVETWGLGRHAYFDSAVVLVFFLLLGRYLERRARARARGAAARHLLMRTQPIVILGHDGVVRNLPPADVQVDMVALVAPGQRVSVDGTIISGTGDVDTSVISGESTPVRVGPGDQVFAGCLNSTGSLQIRVDRVGEDTLLAEITRLMQTAEQRKAKYVERAAHIVRLYTPFVHVLAVATVVGWLAIGGAGWREALLIATAVLIITCPCALGLAVPIVQTVAVGRLVRSGILLKSASALERLAQVNTVIFDKTGVLTIGAPTLTERPQDDSDLRLAARLAVTSHHPLAKAITHAVPDATPLHDVRETPGSGLEASTEQGTVRLGNRDWCGVRTEQATAGMELWLRRPDTAPAQFRFEDTLRADATSTIQTLRDRGYQVGILSGDNSKAVESVAQAVNIDRWRGDLQPREKLQALEQLAAHGQRTLMVGDGINDAPALAAATVSLSPTTATDISQSAADVVFQGPRLQPVQELLAVAKTADRLMRQNFALAIAYNLCAVPLAVIGLVTPLVAAIAMSSSSILVVLNSIRLGSRSVAT